MSEQLKTREVVNARIPTEQVFEWRIVPKAGRLLLAETVGKSLAAMDDIFNSLQPGGAAVCVLDAGFDADGAFYAKIAVLPMDSDQVPAPATDTTSS